MARAEVPYLPVFDVCEHPARELQVALPRTLGPIGVHTERQRIVIRIGRNPHPCLQTQTDLRHTRIEHARPAFAPCGDLRETAGKGYVALLPAGLRSNWTRKLDRCSWW